MRRTPVLKLGLCCATLLASMAGSGAAAAEERSLGLYRDGQLADALVFDTSAQTTPSLFLLEAVPGQVAPAISEDTQFRNAKFRNATLPAADIHERLRRLDVEGLAVEDSDIEFLSRRHADFLAAQADIRAELMEISRQIEAFGLDLVILERHRQTVEAFEAGIEEFSLAVEAVLQGRGGALEYALEVMDRLKAREDPQLLNGNPSYAMQKIEAPRLTRENADRALRAGLAEIPIDTHSGPPTPDDLAATPEIQLTQEIIDKATALGNSPLAIYEFVRNQVHFQGYTGSRKGAVDTLRQLRGNDVDQVSLLLALLRVSGIPSRYVRGTVELDIESAKDWLGVDDGATAGAILATAGFDAVTIVNGPDPVAVRFTHVWAEAYVPYANYRGVPNDATGSLWVALDPSFKGSVVTPGEDVLSAMGFDVDDYLADYVSAFTEPSPIEQLVLDIQAYLDNNDPGKTVADIERRINIEALELGLLPASAQGNVLAIQGTFSELEDSQRYKVRFQLYDGGIPFIDHTLSVLDLAGKRLTIEYIGATPADQDTIDSYNGIYNTPPNLVEVKPLLKLDNVVVATGVNGIGMGRSHNFDMQFLQPAGTSNVQPLVQNQIIAGNGHAIAFDTFLDAHDMFFEDNNFPPEVVRDSMLHITAAGYLSRVSRGLEEAGRLMGMVTTQDVSEAIVKNAIAVSYANGIPVTFEWTGLVVDADRRIVGPFAADGDASKGRPYMVLTGMEGSTLENRIFEDTYDQEAVSTIKILELASDAGINLCTIETSIAVDCPGMSQSAAIINAVNSALAGGHVVTIPEAPITIELWSGTGYIDMDPTTGAAGYIISGGINGDVQVAFGGATVQSWPLGPPCDAPTMVDANVIQPPADWPAPGANLCTDNNRVTFKFELTWTCKDGTIKNETLSVTTDKTSKEIGGGFYNFVLNAFGNSTIERKIALVEVDKLEASEGDEWDDMDGSDDTKTVVLKKAAAGDVTVTATPKPVMAEANLPGCWSLTGGTGAGKLTRTVSKTVAAKTSFRAKSGTSQKDLDVVVAHAKFMRAPTEDAAGNKYGYDEMDAADDNDDHVSVKKSGSTKVKVMMEGGVDRKYLKFVPENEAIAKVTDPGSGTGDFLLEILGQATNKGHTNIKIRAAKKTGAEIANIAANVYKEIVLTAKYFNVFKTGDPSTKVSPAPSGADITTKANSLLKAYVAQLNVGAATDKGIAFDFNGNGKLDYYNTAPNSEYDKVIEDLKAAGAGYADIAIVKDSFPDRWYLHSSIAATPEAPVTKFKVEGAANFIDTTEQWTIADPNGGNAETFSIVSISGDELTIDKDVATPGLQGLTKNHPKTADPKTSETLVAASHKVAGLGNSIPSDKPALIVGATADAIGKTGAHEQSHGQGMADVNDNTNTMHCTTSNAIGNLPFRFLELQRVVTGVCGTNLAGKDNQWETPARP